MDGDEGADFTFSAEETDKAITEVLDEYLADKFYDDACVGQWVDTVCERVIARLAEFKKPYKYVVNTVIMQRNGAGLHAFNTAYWDPTVDGTCVVPWPREKSKDGPNKTLQAIVTVFGVELGN